MSTDPDAAREAGTRDALWYKDAVIYQVHVRAFYDSSGDGIGDFRGLIEKLDYVRDLGVSAIWLQPFYPSPLRDDGYDIADYRNVHPDYGTRADLRQFLREAHRRGLRVITELVINHTSDQHPWFQAARRAPAGSRKRDFYVWSDTDAKYAGTRIIFTDTERSNWQWDEVAGAYYWHRFFSHQPDLNFDNPSVVKAVQRVMRFWFDMGVDGMRLDAIPYLRERDGTSSENLPETHEVIRSLRAELDRHYGDRMLLAEANQWPEDVAEYFGRGDECHMAYHFPLMPRIYMAIAQEDRHPVVDIMRQTPDIPESCQWAIFLRNHDELTLEMVTSRERDYMYRMYAADPRARLNLGIRRRLAPLMQNDPDRIKLMNSLLLSMPGSPIIYYGDEIGMGDNIYLGDRNGVRTPMQWSPDRNAGFSKADPQRLYLPPIMDAVYGYEAVNVEAQSRDPASLLNWVRRVLAVRQTSRAFGRGRVTFLRPGNRKVLAYLRQHGEEVLLCVANLGRTAQPVELDLARFRGRVPVEMMGRTPFPRVSELPYLLTLPAYGFYWFRLATDVDVPSWHEDRSSREDIPVLVLFDGWASLFRDRVVPWRIGMAERVRGQFEQEVIPRFLESERWHGARGGAIARAVLADHVLWQEGSREWLVALFEIEGAAGPAVHFVPLALAWEDGEEERMRALAARTVARVRQRASVGVLADAFADEGFCRALLAAMAARRELACGRGTLRFSPTREFAALAGADYAALPVSRPAVQSSNTLISYGERLFLKVYRRPRAGENPELEIGRYLTETARFTHSVPLAGALEYRGADGSVRTLALLQAYVSNQGDAWSRTLDYLKRAFEGEQPGAADAHGGYLALAGTLGTRTGELHGAFARPSADPAFGPEPVTGADLERWREEALAALDAALALLDRHRGELTLPVRGDARRLRERRAAVAAWIAALGAPAGPALKTRRHGRFHLGQVLITRNDFVIVDFEGEPERDLAERRARHSPLTDVAGMLRSFERARWTALRQAGEVVADVSRLEPVAADWAAQARRAFLAGYEEAARDAGIFASFDEARGLLALFELTAALGELRREIGHRPGWVAVPLAGILVLTEALPGAV